MVVSVVVIIILAVLAFRGHVALALSAHKLCVRPLVVGDEPFVFIVCNQVNSAKSAEAVALVFADQTLMQYGFY
jgi:hypothetical protein